jgi:DNA-directed RNA polymerase I, II, and III subunit RPABC1
MNIADRKKFYLARNTILDILEDRGYIVAENLKMSIDEFMIQYDSGEMYIYTKNSNEDKKSIYIYFHLENRNFQKKDLTNLITTVNNQYQNENIKIIVITRDKLNQAILREIERTDNIESFILNQLIINITKHIMMPKFEVISDNEIEILLKEFSITKNQLPKILLTDPISRYFGVKSGDIFKITRSSPTTGLSISYRLVK